MALILTLANTMLQFFIKVDTSDLGVESVLSQRSLKDNHPCAFFSPRLSLGKQNYTANELDLLAIKLAMVEWHHLLEGSKQLCIG